MSELLAAITGIVLGAILTVVGNVFFDVWRRRRPEHWVTDKEIFVHYRVAFDRQAFRGPYVWNSDPEPFKRAIEATIKAVATGMLLDKQGNELDRAAGASHIANRQRQSAVEDVQRRLQEIKRLVSEEGLPTPEVAARIDQERDEIINELNCIWRALSIAPLDLPTSKEAGERFGQE